MLKKIISGGQTGVDRSALDAAIEKKFPCGGYCPKGRRAEDGPINNKYPLTETTSSAYQVRTKSNIIDSDGTLIITKTKPDGGTALTISLCKNLKKSFFIFSTEKDYKNQVAEMMNWLETNKIEILNIAGPRESKEPGIYKESKELILKELI